MLKSCLASNACWRYQLGLLLLRRLLIDLVRRRYNEWGKLGLLLVDTLLCLWLAHPVPHPNIADGFVSLMHLVSRGVYTVPREQLSCHVINSSLFGFCLLMVKDAIKVDLHCVIEGLSNILASIPTRTWCQDQLLWALRCQLMRLLFIPWGDLAWT